MIEIYWDDLIIEKQAEILAELGNNCNHWHGNYDMFPEDWGD